MAAGDVLPVCKEVERIVIVEQSVKSAHHRIDKSEAQTEAVIQLGVEIKHLTEVITLSVIPQLVHHDQRIDAVENRPGAVALKWWKTTAVIIATATLTGVVGYLLGAVLT